MTARPDLDQAYAFCGKLARSHYENFPVASWLLPKRLRRPVSVIYAFARTADDYADEGTLPCTERLARLDSYGESLRQIGQQRYTGNDPVFIALQDVIARHALPVELFDDLLTAFRQDVLKSRYANFDEVLQYCRYSANPVGRLLLGLNGRTDDRQLTQSDAICSALQLINFYQDVVQDLTEQDRVYIPQDELAEAGLDESALLDPDTRDIAPLLRRLYRRAAALMRRGHHLGADLHGRLGWEVRAMTLGGITTLNMLQNQPDSALLARPRLRRSQLLKIILASGNRAVYLRTANRLLPG